MCRCCYLYFTTIGEKIYINQVTKPSKINGLRRLSNAYKYFTQGEHIYIQLKSVENPAIKKMKIVERYNVEKVPLTESSLSEKVDCQIDVLKYKIETSLLKTVEKMGSAVPVLLVVVDVNTRDTYYVCLNDYIEKVIIPSKPQYYNQKSIILSIPTKNKIDETTGRSIIEWYAKRAKLFAFFNKVSYQYHELQYSNGDMELAKHFANSVSRLDAWSAAKYFPALDFAKNKFFYYFEHGKPESLDNILSHLKELGHDIDSEEWETNTVFNTVSLSTSMGIQEVFEIWRLMENVGRIFEDLIKEADLPTYIGHDMTIWPCDR